jgi:hypothetical protein
LMGVRLAPNSSEAPAASCTYTTQSAAHNIILVSKWCRGPAVASLQAGRCTTVPVSFFLFHTCPVCGSV